MAQNSNTTIASADDAELRFISAPLASGGSVTADDEKRPITGVTVLVTVEGSSDPVRVELEYRYGGWWASEETTNGR